MVNLSFFTSKTYVGIYKDKIRSTYSSKKQWPFFFIKNGEAFIYDGKSWGQDFNLKLTGTDVEYIASGYPILLQGGKKTKINKSFFSRRKCPRTAIGIHPNGSIFLYVTTSATLKDVQSYFTSIGCTDAINFDGGGSTFLYLDGIKVHSSNQGRSYPNILSW
jgi:exopolysaccharide biosynthesis protein